MNWELLSAQLYFEASVSRPSHPLLCKLFCNPPCFSTLHTMVGGGVGIVEEPCLPPLLSIPFYAGYSGYIFIWVGYICTKIYSVITKITYNIY